MAWFALAVKVPKWSQDSTAPGTGFWSYAERRLAQLQGLNKSAFPVHPEKTGFRFDHRNH